MSYLFDTNIFLRLTNNADPAHTLAVEALRALRKRGEALCFTPQVLAEFWSVCTRPPSARGGFGLLPPEVERRARVIERYFRLLPDSVVTYQEWRRLLANMAQASFTPVGNCPDSCGRDHLEEQQLRSG